MSYTDLVLSVNNLAEKSSELKVAAQNVQVASEEARDSSEAFAIDALSSVTESQNLLIKVPLDAAQAAQLVVANKIDRIELAGPTGATKTGYGQRTVDARLSECVSIADVGAVGNDSTNAKPAIELAKAKNVPVLVPTGTFKILSDTMITAPSIEFLSGGKINVPAGVVLTIDAALIAPPSQIFTGDGVVILTRKARLKYIHIEWWGGNGDGVVDNQPATIAAIRTIGYSSSAVSVIQYLSGQYLYGGPVIIPAGGIQFKGVRPVDSYLNAASAGATRISSTGTWTGFLFDVPNNSVSKPGIRFDDMFIGVSTTQRQGIWRMGTEVRGPIFSHIGAVGAGLQILQSEAGITQIIGGYWNNGCMLDVDINNAPLTSYVGVVELSAPDWRVTGAHIGHDNPTSGIVGLTAALYVKSGGASGRCSDTVLEQADVTLVCDGNDGIYTNLRVELSGKEAIVVTGSSNQFANTKVGIQVSARSPGTYDAILVSGGGNIFTSVNNDLNTGSCKDFIHDTRGFDSFNINQYSGLPPGRPHLTAPLAVAYGNIAGLVLRADGICSLIPPQAIFLYVNLETNNVINADNVQNIHGRRPLTPVTRIENGVPGQVITLMLNQGSTTFAHNAAGGNLRMLTKADTVTPQMTPISFLKMVDGLWYQTR